MRRTRWIAVLAVALSFAAGWYWGRGGEVVYAQGPPEFAVGAHWGPLRGSLGDRLLLFEDQDGTIRVVDVTASNPSTKMLQVERLLTRR